VAFVLRPDGCGRGYDRVILGAVKTTISLPDDTFRRIDDAAKRPGVSHSEFFARAAERWLESLDDDGTTAAVNRVIAGLEPDHKFTDVAAAVLASSDPEQ
jgi:metal-responsive CopG/Arc/MetJ family transcriptional regulator